MGFLVIGWIVLSVVVGLYASTKGHSGFGMFVVALILSPPIGFIVEAMRTPNTKLSRVPQ